MRNYAASGLFAFLIWMPGPALAQFSPGPLSAAHRSLNGMTKCVSCHVPAGGDRRHECLSCHKEIAQRLAANRGMHPAWTDKAKRDDGCVKCHSEHLGEASSLIRWETDPKKLDHSKTGYPLEGGHAGVACAKCHSPANIPAAAKALIKIKDLRRTYLGLGRECRSCHADIHRGQLNSRCESCHVVAAWKDVSKFDHAKAKYPLSGAHARIACAKCHPATANAATGKMFVRFTGIAFASCSSCHKDVHRGAFREACSACHIETAWKQVRNLQGAFDHSKTDFPLLGKHAPVACAECHRTADYKAPVAHGRCLDCHKDTHGGQFLTRPGGGDCAGCHNASDWKKSTFDEAAHQASGYPLTGLHRKVNCAQCHVPAGEATRYKMSFAQCADCHRDPHNNEFAVAPHQGRCESCHTVDRFVPAKYNVDRHNRESRFPLRGAHAAAGCVECHKGAGFPAKVSYRLVDRSCESCHWDPHQDAAQANQIAKGKKDRAGCAGCHTERDWHEISAFDHGNTRFPLEGAHAVAGCQECHKANALSINLKRVVFSTAPRNCDGCHEDVHAGQFASAANPKPECASCHGVKRWRPAKVDHDRTAFPLDGSHARVPCADCHQKRPAGTRMVAFYREAPKDCAACHGPQNAK